jgi:hypothetical protein
MHGPVSDAILRIFRWQEPLYLRLELAVAGVPGLSKYSLWLFRRSRQGFLGCGDLLAEIIGLLDQLSVISRVGCAVLWHITDRFKRGGNPPG